jgi:hypothetical protein
MAETPPGVGADSHGNPVIDPTKNVGDILAAAVKRLDDLQATNNERTVSEITHVREVVKIHSDHHKELLAMQVAAVQSARQFDVAAVNTAADRNAREVKTLADATGLLAETLRKSVTESATAMDIRLNNMSSVLSDRLASLEKSSYTGQGKDAVVDPQMTVLIDTVRQLAAAQQAERGKGDARQLDWKNGMLVVMAVIALVSMYFSTQRSVQSASIPGVTAR